MVRSALVPKPIAFVCGGLSFTLHQAYSLFVGLALPRLFELWPESPRLAWTGILLVIASPAWSVTFLHRVGHRVLDVFDASRKGAAESFGRSLWAGMLAWMVLVVSSTLTTLLLLAIDPPQAPEPDMIRAFLSASVRPFAGGTVVSAYSFVWVTVASFLYQLERANRSAT